jgi:hypothetical protein
MGNKPIALSREEMKEIAAMEDIQQMWGADNPAEMEEMLDTIVYAVKFNYEADGPGYVGDYFILQGGALGEAIELVRNKDGQIIIIDGRPS